MNPYTKTNCPANEVVEEALEKKTLKEVKKLLITITSDVDIYRRWDAYKLISSALSDTSNGRNSTREDELVDLQQWYYNTAELSTEMNADILSAGLDASLGYTAGKTAELKRRVAAEKRNVAQGKRDKNSYAYTQNDVDKAMGF